MLFTRNRRYPAIRPALWTGLWTALGLAPLFALAAIVLSAPAHAQGAGKPIKIVFPFPAGSAGDTVSRIIAATLQAQTGRTVLVENRSGASSGRATARTVVS